MSDEQPPDPKIEECISLVRQKLQSSIPRPWSFNESDLDAGLTVLRTSLEPFLQEGKWQKAAHWIFGLAESIAYLSVALSTEPDETPRPDPKVSSVAFFLAAVLVCNACGGRRDGKACSAIKVSALPGPDGIKNLFRFVYGESGLPISDR